MKNLFLDMQQQVSQLFLKYQFHYIKIMISIECLQFCSDNNTPISQHNSILSQFLKNCYKKKYFPNKSYYNQPYYQLLTIKKYIISYSQQLVLQQMALIILLILLIPTISSDPYLLSISTKNQCIKNIIQKFITNSACNKLSQNLKSQLALQMTNCLFQQMGKSIIICLPKTNCQLKGDSWNTFTTFFTHIDNLCHFYWDISKAERTEQMIDALRNSAQNTQKTLQKNTENTKQILQLQTVLRLQILNSLSTQQQMSKMTQQISQSLTRIHTDIDQHYLIITRILSTINKILIHLDSLHQYLIAQVRSVQGMLFFVTLIILVLIGCIISHKVRVKKNQCFIFISLHFLVEFFFSGVIHDAIGIQPMRCICIIVIIILVLSAKSSVNHVQITLQKQLNSQRLGRILQRALRKQISQISHSNNLKKADN